ncbi:MAG: DUF2007 domain-containing protein [Acidobacteriota bacterium]|nr:DUF2007 domain-containing protein [Acidobacteriota bacterium]
MVDDRGETIDDQEWGVAKVVENDQEAIVVAGFLKSNGIPAEVESLHVEELPVNLGAMGEVRVRVPAEHLAEALALLEAQEAIGAAALGAPESREALAAPDPLGIPEAQARSATPLETASDRQVRTAAGSGIGGLTAVLAEDAEDRQER